MIKKKDLQTDYYILEHSLRRKEVGYFLQTQGTIDIDGYDLKCPNSRCNIERDKFPDFVPDLRFGLEPKAKLTDIVKESNISATGYLMNEKVKNIFDQCKLPPHRYYEASILDQEGNTLPYYWMQILSNDYSLIDFEKSVFRNSSSPLRDRWRKEGPVIQINDIEEFSKKHLVLDAPFAIADIIRINDKEHFDMLYFDDLECCNVFISKRLAELLMKEKVTGIEAVADPDFENI